MPEKDPGDLGFWRAIIQFAKHRHKHRRRHPRETLHPDLLMVDPFEWLATDIDNRNRVQLNNFLTLLEPADLAHSHQHLADFEGVPAKPPRHGLGPGLKLALRRIEAYQSHK